MTEVEAELYHDEISSIEDNNAMPTPTLLEKGKKLRMDKHPQDKRPRPPTRSNGKSGNNSRRHSANLSEDSSNTTKSSLTKPLRLRICLAGSENSGKSCIIKRYCEKRFVARHNPTIGIDYGATRIYVDSREVSVHVFDTSGSNLFRDVRNEFYRDAHGIVLVFDVTDRASFESLSQWTKEIYSELARLAM